MHHLTLRALVTAGWRLAVLAVLSLALAACSDSAAESPKAIRVLVTNDDGVAAGGIDAVVEALRQLGGVEIDVYAPATNQSGTGDRVSTGPLVVASTTTASGFPATSVAGYPADSVLFGLLQGLPPAKPDLVVSGINAGQNVADLTRISGTVGAAQTAARLGIPAIAASQALGSGFSFAAQAQYVAELVEEFQRDASFRRRMIGSETPPRGIVLNVNFPTCVTGSLRGVRVVALGELTVPTGWSQVGDPASGTWQLQTRSVPPGSNDCASTNDVIETDLDALDSGFASVTPLGADTTQSGLLDDFPELER